MIIFRATYRDKVTGETRTTDKYYLRYEGKKIPLGTTDRRIAEQKAKQIITQMQLGHDPKAEQTAKKEDLGQLTGLFIARIEARTGDRHREQMEGRLRKLAKGLKARELQDLTCEKCQAWLDKSKLAARTRHHYRRHLLQFGAFLIKTGRANKNPFAGLEPVTGVEADRKLQRRALSDEEIAKLIAAVPNSKYARCRVKPADRAWLYRTASLTGFRRDELASLTPASFRLDGADPHIYLEANATKNGKEAHQPIPAAFAEELRGYLKGKKEGEPLWGIANRKTARMIRMDLVEAGVPVEVAGRVADFHGLRVTFGTNCALKQVPLAMAQRLMRHSTPVLTSNIYTVAQLSDLSKEVEKLG